jgi:hypothetical protein
LEVTKKGKRIWAVEMKRGNDPPNPMKFQDIWPRKDYELFRHYVDQSFAPQLHKLTEQESQEKLKRALSRIPRYTQKLRKRLQHYCAEVQGREIIFMIEERGLPAVTDTFHSMVWELLEHHSGWDDTNKPARVTVIRVICRGDNSGTIQQLSTCFPPQDPIRILLVIGRDLSKFDTEWKEDISPGLIQRPIMQAIQHLEEIGHSRQIELDILRASTLAELDTFLDRAPKPDYYNLIHLDMHGEKWEATVSHLLLSTTAPDPWVPASEVAAIVCKHAKLVVMNACNSTASGGPGISMVRPFLQGRVTYVSSANFRLLERAARIYYPVFYMSLFLYENFHDAVVTAREELRRNTLRVRNEHRDDAFVQSVYSNSLTRHTKAIPSPSFHLHSKAFLDTILAGLCSMLKRAYLWRGATSVGGCNYSKLRNDICNLQCHVSMAQEIRIPEICLPILEIEYKVRMNAEQTVYIHAGDPRNWHIQHNTRYMIRNMARVWIRTNFVSEVHIVSVPALMHLPSFLIPYNCVFFNHGHTIYRQHRGSSDRRPPEIKRMLIVEEVDRLDPQEGTKTLTSAQRAALRRIGDIFAKLKTLDGKLYHIVMGKKDGHEWNRGQHDLPLLGASWATAQEILVLQDEEVTLASFRRNAKVT